MQKLLLAAFLFAAPALATEFHVAPTGDNAADGSPLAVDTDYFGKPRDKSNPFPGPFETPVNGEVKVWPK